ncbi:hypothetical protein B0H14DRAFT_2326997, partial [Mycena olivaceomarginata]
WWNADEEEALKVHLKTGVMQVFKRAEALPRYELGELLTDVYAGEEPWNIILLTGSTTLYLLKIPNTICFPSFSACSVIWFILQLA